MFSRAIWARERQRQNGECIGVLDLNEKGYDTFRATATEGTEERQSRDLPSLAIDWMSRVDDEVLISDLTIPGTHDSAAFTYSWPFVQTQQLKIGEQLDAGIRYFDLRCGVRDDIAEMVHGTAYLGLTLTSVLDTMCSWLENHQSEALIVQIKQDREPERSTVHFAHAVWKCIDTNRERWRTANTTPTLAELRGRIQLLRRFTGPSLHAYGIDVTKWQDNPKRPFTIYGKHQVYITIQDHYSFSDPQSLPSLITRKGGDVAELLRRADEDSNPGHWYINFTSAFEFNLLYQLPPREIAVGGWWAFRWEEGMNPRVRNYIYQRGGRRRYGIVAMDFPERGAEDLIETLIATNFGQEEGATISWRTLLLTLAFLLLVAVAATSLSLDWLHHDWY